MLARFEEMGFLRIEVSQVSRKINSKQRSKSYFTGTCAWMADLVLISHLPLRNDGNQNVPHAERSKNLEAIRRLFQAWGSCRVEGMWNWSTGRFSLSSFLVTRNSNITCFLCAVDGEKGRKQPNCLHQRPDYVQQSQRSRNSGGDSRERKH